LKGDVSDLAANIEEREDAIATLKTEIAGLHEAVSNQAAVELIGMTIVEALNKSVVEATEYRSTRPRRRKEEHEEYTSTAASNQAAVELIGMTMNRTQKFLQPEKEIAGFSIAEIAGDGRCLFRSIVHCAKQLGVVDFFEDVFDSNRPGEQDAADRLREYVMLELRKRRGEEGVKIALLAEGLSLDQYIQHMSQPHSWGGALEIYMASYVIACPIWVWQPGEDVDANLHAGNLVNTAKYGDEFGGEAKAVHLRFSSKRDHYDGLLFDHQERARESMSE